jgi:hypothetical protein
MSDGASLLLSLYLAERDDERAFWGTTCALTLGALTLLGAVALIPNDAPWYVWCALPLLSIPIVTFGVHEAAVGARRRHYMAALEASLARSAPTITVEGVRLPATSFTRYSWWMNTGETHLVRGGAVAWLFWFMSLFAWCFSALVLLLVAGLHLRDDNGWGAWALGIPVLCYYATLIAVSSRLMQEDSRQLTWTFRFNGYPGEKGPHRQPAYSYLTSLDPSATDPDPHAHARRDKPLVEPTSIGQDQYRGSADGGAEAGQRSPSPMSGAGKGSHDRHPPGEGG